MWYNQNNIYMPIRCLTEKGEVRFIPEKLASMPDYMRRHRLTLDSIEEQEPLRPLSEVNLEVVAPIEDVEKLDEPTKSEFTKEDYWAMLDAKGVEYKKTFGITKLKELNDAN